MPLVALEWPCRAEVTKVHAAAKRKARDRRAAAAARRRGRMPHHRTRWVLDREASVDPAGRRPMTASMARPESPQPTAVAPFDAPYAPADEEIAAGSLAEVPLAAAAEQRIDARATGLVEAIRARQSGLGGIEDFLHEYSLSTK